MSVTFRDSAFVLKAAPTRDADRRYVVFGRERGKMLLLAKGVRKGQSKMSPHMAWFGSVDIMVARGRVFDRLAGASLRDPYSGLLQSLHKSAAAQAFLLTVDALTRQEQPEPEIYRLIGEFFSVLDGVELVRSPDGRGPVFDSAVLKLLDIVGFGPELDLCVQCRQPFGQSASMNFFRGGLECRSCRRPESLPVMAETVERLRKFRSRPLAEAVGEPPPYQAVSRILETLLINHVDDRYPALNFLRRAVAGTNTL